MRINQDPGYADVEIMSNWTELPDRNRLRGVAQRADFWCVPATVTSMLTYHGIHVPQEELILAYCERFKDQGPLSRPDGSAVALDGLTREQVIEAARGSRLNHANFKHFGEIAHEVRDLTKWGVRLTHVDDIPGEALVTVVCDNLKAGCPVGVSATSGERRFHVCVAFAAEPDALHCYDPALDGRVVLRSETTTFAKDLLCLEKAQT